MTPPPSSAPSVAATPSPRAGVIRFGADYTSGTLTVVSPSTEFSVGSSFAYSAELSEPANTTTVRIVWAKELEPGGASHVVLSREVQLADPRSDVLADKAAWPALLEGTGSYVVRVLRDNVVLAEGRFRLVPAPSPTPTPASRQLTVTASGFGVSNGFVGYGFTLKNESPSESARSVNVRVAWQDASGAVLKTKETQLDADIEPGEHTGFADTEYFFPPLPSAAKLSVQVLSAKWSSGSASAPPLPPFTFSNAAYVGDVLPDVTATIMSPYPVDLKLVQVNVLGVDPSGRIVGGGETLIDVIPAGATMAVKISYTGTRPASLALYAHLTDLTLLLLPTH